MTGLFTLAMASASWLGVLRAGANSQPLQVALKSGFLDTIVVLAVLVDVVGFLFLVCCVCWGAQHFVRSCLQHQRTEQRLAEMLREYLELQRLSNEQLWLASSALSPC